MAFALMAAALVALVAAGLAQALWREEPAESRRDEGQAWRAQLDALRRDRARGLLSPAAALQARRRLARRMLAGDRATGPNATPAAARWLALGLIAAGLLAGVGLYLWLGAPGMADRPMAERLAAAQRLYDSRPDQAEAEAMAAQMRPVPAPAGHDLALIEALRAAVAGRPGDLRGLGLLARSEAALGQYARAEAAQRALIAARGSAGDHAGLGEIEVAAAGGLVSAGAEAEFRAALRMAPGNGSALYHLGLMWAQNDRPDLAFALWRRLPGDAPADSPWLATVRRDIGALAAAAGVPDYRPSPETDPAPVAERPETAP
uniref:c-type cytochrome biogenesis protein CcmI n=1 Tax=Paenirhodobacter enshiensis TaxID=1105367 RepID=UPI0035B3CCF8